MCFFFTVYGCCPEFIASGTSHQRRVWNYRIRIRYPTMMSVRSLRASKLTRLSSREKMHVEAEGKDGPMSYDFLVETYETERMKVVSVWSELRDEERPRPPPRSEPRRPSWHEQMVHQCASEHL